MSRKRGTKYMNLKTFRAIARERKTFEHVAIKLPGFQIDKLKRSEHAERQKHR